MKNLELILDKASTERANEKRASLVIKNKKPKSIVKPSSGSFKIFAKLFYHHYHSFHWIIIGSAVIIIGINMYTPFIGWPKDVVLLFPVTLVALAIIWMPIYLIILIMNYYPYRQFVTSPPFTVKGWRKINEYDNFPRYRFWTATTFTVTFKEGAPNELIHLVNEALYLLNKSLDKCYYKTGDPDFDDSCAYKDYRKKWQRPKKEKTENTSSIHGHANSKVCWKIYRFTNGLLRDINKKYKNIESVEIIFSNEIYRLSARSSGDSGVVM